MRRFLVVGTVVCSLLWAVTGVSVLAIALHEHHHHHAETHNHEDAFELVLHCHDNGGSPHHDHELTAAMNGSRSSGSGFVNVAVSQANDLDDTETTACRASAIDPSRSRDYGPPAFLLHCVLLT